MHHENLDEVHNSNTQYENNQGNEEEAGNNNQGNSINEEQNMDTTTVNTNITTDDEYTMDNEEYTTNDETEHEYTEEDRITIEDINITREKNTSQMAIEQEEGGNTEEAQESPTHGYNLRK